MGKSKSTSNESDAIQFVRFINLTIHDGNQIVFLSDNTLFLI